MTKRESREALQALLKELEKSPSPDQYWLNRAFGYFETIFGKDSIHYKNLSSIQYYATNTDNGELQVTVGGIDPKERYRHTLNAAILETRSPLFHPLLRNNPATPSAISQRENKQTIISKLERFGKVAQIIGGIFTLVYEIVVKKILNR